MKVEVSVQAGEEMEVTNMSTDKNLLEEMLSSENLNQAYLKVVVDCHIN